MCGEAGVSALRFHLCNPPHPLFKTIISCSIIHTIFTRANYTRPRHAEKMGFRVFYCCTHRLEMRGCSTRGRNLWLELPLFSQGVSPRSVTRVTLDAECTISTFQFKLIQSPSLLCLLVNMKQPSLEQKLEGHSEAAQN